MTPKLIRVALEQIVPHPTEQYVNMKPRVEFECDLGPNDNPGEVHKWMQGYCETMLQTTVEACEKSMMPQSALTPAPQPARLNAAPQNPPAAVGYWQPGQTAPNVAPYNGAPTPPQTQQPSAPPAYQPVAPPSAYASPQQPPMPPQQYAPVPPNRPAPPIEAYAPDARTLEAPPAHIGDGDFVA